MNAKRIMIAVGNPANSRIIFNKRLPLYLSGEPMQSETALWQRSQKDIRMSVGFTLSGVWSHRESNPNLIFRRDLFYPLNYETPCRCCGLCVKKRRITVGKGTAFRVNRKINILIFCANRIKLSHFGIVKSIV